MRLMLVFSEMSSQPADPLQSHLVQIFKVNLNTLDDDVSFYMVNKRSKGSHTLTSTWFLLILLANCHLLDEHYI